MRDNTGAKQIAQYHIDRLIDIRAGGLFEGPLGPARKQILRQILHYKKAIAIGARVIDLPDGGALEFLRRFLDMDLRVEGIENVPRRGGFIMVSNHPTGIADGIVAYELLKARRPDLIFFANKDVLEVVPGLASHIIPVEWDKAKRSPEKSRAILVAAAKACRAGRAVVLFPSGRLGHMTWRGLRERPWQATGVGLARKFDIPIVPIHMSGRNSILFYLFSFLSTELRDITLFHEVLNKRRSKVRIRVGEPIDWRELPPDAQDATALLQRHVESGLTWPADPAAEPAGLVAG